MDVARAPDSVLVPVHESGFRIGPLVSRTWAPRGHTPRRAQQAGLHCRVCAAAALALAPRRRRVGLDFRLQSDANLTAAKIVRYLRHLRRQLQRPLVVVWGRLGGHCGYVVQRILRRCRGVHR